MTFINFMKFKNFFLIISIVLILISTIAFYEIKPNLGIDFTGGTILQCKIKDKEIDIQGIRNILKQNNIESSVIKFGKDNEFLIKIALNQTKKTEEEIFNIVQKKYKDLELRRTEKIGAKVGKELVEKGSVALILTILIILIYVSIRFEWRFAVASSIALFHDIFITIGMVFIFGTTINLEILAAILTILGYSINDTIVVFDRIREELNNKDKNLDNIINNSINKTLTRTLLTSLTTLFVVLSVYIYGGELVNGLALTLLIGIIIGTYSSIFIASPLLEIMGFDVNQWDKKEKEKLKRKKEKEKLRAMYENGTV